MSENPKDRLWSKDDVCEFLGIKKSTLYVMVARDEIPHLRVANKLRFIPEQMWAWAKKETVKKKSAS